MSDTMDDHVLTIKQRLLAWTPAPLPTNPPPVSVEDWHRQLLEMAAESAEQEPSTVSPTAELQQAFADYYYDLRQALGDWVVDRGLAPSALEAMYDADAEYNVYMTLAGHGVGIWDGRWDHILDSGQIEDLTKHLRARVGKHVDDAGGGALDVALDNAVYEAALTHTIPSR